MAKPTILVDSTNGAASDTLCSGAGPTTALTGTAGVSDVAGTTVTLDGSPNLSGVATDGSAVLYFADATAGHRNFASISGTANSGTPTAAVTLNEAVTGSLTKSWAIGGVRATVAGTVSYKLIENNSAAGDAMPGWITEMQSGHSESTGQQFVWRRGGDNTSGPITLRGKSGAATLPLLTYTANSDFIQNRVDGIVCQDFEVQNTNATKTASVVFNPTNIMHVRRIKCSHATNKFWKFTSGASNGAMTLQDCYIALTASDAVTFGGSGGGRIENCAIISPGGVGITLVGNLMECIGNLIAGATGDGIKQLTTGNTGSIRGNRIERNTIDSCTSHGIEIQATTTATNDWLGLTVENNNCSNNGGYGLNFSGSGVSQVQVDLNGTRIRNNNLYNNTSGTINPAITNENGLSADPQYVNTAGGDYSLGPNSLLRGAGYP